MIEIRGLVKSYGEPVLDGVELSVDAGGVFALLGPNGAGKTTLISILTTLIRPDSGTARIGGLDVTREPGALRRLIAVTGQEARLDDLLTGRENLQLFARLLGLGREATRRADELLEQFGFNHAACRTVATYSGGMRRRLDLAVSLILRSAVLFLDEPTTGLDPASRRRVWEDVRHLAGTGTTVFLTTQTLDEAEALAQRVAVLHHGRIIADGSPDDLIARVGSQRLVLLDRDGTEVREIDTDATAVALSRVLEELTQPERRLRVQLRSPTLDDAFLALTRSPDSPRRSHHDDIH